VANLDQGLISGRARILISQVEEDLISGEGEKGERK
jgi:hypothetical protein